jgi:hypothetical protein
MIFVAMSRRMIDLSSPSVSFQRPFSHASRYLAASAQIDDMSIVAGFVDAPAAGRLPPPAGVPDTLHCSKTACCGSGSFASASSQRLRRWTVGTGGALAGGGCFRVMLVADDVAGVVPGACPCRGCAEGVATAGDALADA